MGRVTAFPGASQGLVRHPPRIVWGWNHSCHNTERRKITHLRSLPALISSWNESRGWYEFTGKFDASWPWLVGVGNAWDRSKQLIVSLAQTVWLHAWRGIWYERNPLTVREEENRSWVASGKQHDWVVNVDVGQKPCYLWCCENREMIVQLFEALMAQFWLSSTLQMPTRQLCLGPRTGSVCF